MHAGVRGGIVPTREEYESALRGIVMLADEYGPALNTGHRILADGALVGPHAVALERAMIDQDRKVNRAFSDAFNAVMQLALTDPQGPPRVPPPRQARPPIGNAQARLGVAGGDTERFPFSV